MLNKWILSKTRRLLEHWPECSTVLTSPILSFNFWAEHIVEEAERNRECHIIWRLLGRSYSHTHTSLHIGWRWVWVHNATGAIQLCAKGFIGKTRRGHLNFSAICPLPLVCAPVLVHLTDGRTDAHWCWWWGGLLNFSSICVTGTNPPQMLSCTAATDVHRCSAFCPALSCQNSFICWLWIGDKDGNAEKNSWEDRTGGGGNSYLSRSKQYHMVEWGPGYGTVW